MRQRRTAFRLSDKDVERLDQIASSLGGRRRHGGVQKAIADYERLIEDLRKGYWGNANDYAQDLDARAYLERALVALDGSLQERLARVLQDLDVRFVEVTRDDADDRLRQFHRHDGSWYWRRVPAKPGRLANDLLR
jgi:hypothetical protein